MLTAMWRRSPHIRWTPTLSSCSIGGAGLWSGELFRLEELARGGDSSPQEPASLLVWICRQRLAIERVLAGADELESEEQARPRDPATQDALDEWERMRRAARELVKTIQEANEFAGIAALQQLDPDSLVDSQPDDLGLPTATPSVKTFQLAKRALEDCTRVMDSARQLLLAASLTKEGEPFCAGIWKGGSGSELLSRCYCPSFFR
jgi:hypothetical protein